MNEVEIEELIKLCDKLKLKLVSTSGEVRWIKLKDKEPPINMAILFYVEPYGVNFGYYEGKNEDEEYKFLSCNELMHHYSVTHWMPLPEPPDAT